MEDQEQEDKNMVDVITVDVPLFIRLLEFAREDATDDMKLHSVTEKLIEMCQDGDIMTMEQYDDIVGTKADGADTSGMNAVEDDMHPQNKNMNEINEQRWMKLAGIITENEATEGGASFTIGDYVYVFGGEETEAGEVIGSDPEGVTVALDNGKTIKVSPDSIQTSKDFFNENKSTEAAAWLVDEENGLPKILRFASIKQAKNNQIDDMADNPRKRSLFTSLTSLADYLEKAYDITNVEPYRYLK
jgi:gamma-glutamylcyclotransferase (GGCT)/AIG2-like uncharacterized protein YtfP